MIKVRHIKPHELVFLNEMLYQVIFVPDGEQQPSEEIIQHPDLVKYAEDLGREGDCCLVSELDGNLVGAIWTRIFSKQNKGYGYVDSQTTELCMTLYPSYKHKGTEGKMIQKQEALGYKNVSLSVDKANYVLKLYERYGFVGVESTNASITMVKPLGA
ncbi:GNAT family N-acetyltransferase [Perlabentimonas gracilis]|uniref:GNAT family N-acetyltransferase n=1 Tax=Perlabentimonas gracilis TaxID=2715279 RepID=UPI001408F3A9|nr:GNAT family N-acetyltransferase [Perlabentimonas gracilis]NHB69118.1 GNAT family N-acetyltransferase [Perlabentimonas gracilis]